MRSTGADVDGEVGLRANLVEEVHELVRSEGVWFNYAAPIGIECYGSLRADAVAPVVFVGEAATRPTHVRHPQRFHCSDNIATDSAYVWNFGVRANPDAFVNTVAQVFGELPEEVAVNLRASLENVNGHIDFLCCRHRRSHSHSEQNEAGKK